MKEIEKTTNKKSDNNIKVVDNVDSICENGINKPMIEEEVEDVFDVNRESNLNNPEGFSDIARYIDSEGRIKTWPSKRELKLRVLEYIVKSFELNHFYTEKEVNSIIEKNHTFRDYFLLRRGLIDARLLGRERDGSRYWRIY